MARYVLIRDDVAAHIVPETPLPLEANLHDALTGHPELLPAEDMGLGRTVVVGRESLFASGKADLILIDDRGQICLVEVKKHGNPDMRRVVAQLLDYAAALWGKTLDQFERDVLLPYLRVATKDGPLGLHQFLLDAFGVAPESAESADVPPLGIDEIEDALAETLRTGHFVLVLAAPEIPPGVEQVLSYLNAQGHRLYGLEVSYFNGPAECFVPRLVVQPTRLERMTHGGAGGRDWDEPSLLAELTVQRGEEEAGTARTILDWSRTHFSSIQWGSGAKKGGFVPTLDHGGRSYWPFWVYTTGTVDIQFQWMRNVPPFDNAVTSLSFLDKLNQIPGVSIPPDAMAGRPKIPLALLAEPASLAAFFDAVDWFLSEARLKDNPPS